MRITGRRERTTRKVRVVASVALLLVVASALPAALASPVIDSALVLRQANGQQPFNGPLGVAVDLEHGEIVVANTGLSRIEFFDFRTFPRGSFMHRVPDGAGGLRDGRPSHVAVDSAGRILVSDLSAAFVDVMDFRGRSLQRLTLPAPDHEIGAGSGPGALAVGPDGSLLVASRGTEGRVHVFGPDAAYRTTWGAPGSEAGRLSGITALAFTPEGRVVVTCLSTVLAVQLFERDGRFVRGWGVHDNGPGNFSYPSGVTVTRDGRIWVSDAIRQLIQVFDPAGTFLGAVGGSGLGPGEFTYPGALAGDGRGMLALVEPMGNRLQLMWVR